jgi:hypothetical protein
MSIGNNYDSNITKAILMSKIAHTSTNNWYNTMILLNNPIHEIFIKF